MYKTFAYCNFLINWTANIKYKKMDVSAIREMGIFFIYGHLGVPKPLFIQYHKMCIKIGGCKHSQYPFCYGLFMYSVKGAVSDL